LWARKGGRVKAKQQHKPKPSIRVLHGPAAPGGLGSREPRGTPEPCQQGLGPTVPQPGKLGRPRGCGQVQPRVEVTGKSI